MKKALFMLFMLPQMALANNLTNDLISCDTLYSKRGNDSLLASDCYRTLLTNSLSPGDQKLIYERVFIALSSVVDLQPATDAEGIAITKALALLDQMQISLPVSADYFYWLAVFTSFNSTRLDRGSILPRNMFRMLRSIQGELNQAHTTDPTIHFFGPSRVIGIMHTSMPAIAGGDKRLAEVRLAEAYSAFPNLSANCVAYAKILIINSKFDLAKTVLTKFLSKSDNELNPFPNEPLRAPKAELFRDRDSARTMLSSF